MKPLNMLFRVDASNIMGTGHLYECLWFAEKTKVRSLFCIHENRKSRQLIERYGFPIASIPKKEQGTKKEYERINRIIAEWKPDIMVVDIPHLTNAYIRDISLGRTKLVVLNALLHPVQAKTHIATVFSPHKKNAQFFGPKYILLRKSFSEQRAVKPSRKVKRVLILFGGADPGNFTLKTLKALANIPNTLHVTVVLGGAFAHGKEVRAFLKTFPKPHRLFVNVRNDKVLLSIMRQADMAFVSGGYTLAELMRLGIPCIALSQNRIEEKMIMGRLPQDAFVNLGRGRSVSVPKLRKTAMTLMNNAQKRRELSSKAARVVDGKGIDRVFTIIKRQ